MKRILALFIACILMGTVFAQQVSNNNASPAANLTIDVNEGIELLSVIQFLGGQLGNSTPSKYKSELKKYFLPYRNHPAATTMFSFDYVIYPDMVEWGFLFYDFPNIKMHPMPDSSSWYKLVPKKELQNYFAQCMQFYNDTKFHSFYISHHADYLNWGAGLEKKIAEPVNTFNRLFNRDGKYNWIICLDPLNDWGAHNIIAANIVPQLKNNIVYQLGYMGDVDSAGNMSFKTNVYDIAWHEGAHAVTDEILKKYRVQIDSLAFLMKNDADLKKQNITDWQHYFNELVARCVSIAMHKKYRSTQDYEKLLKFETGRGFVHAKDVSDIMYDEFINEQKVQRFEDVFPAIFKMLQSKYQQ